LRGEEDQVGRFEEQRSLSDVLAAWELGLLSGAVWLRSLWSPDEVHVVRQLVDGDEPEPPACVRDEVARSGIKERLDTVNDPGADAAFWRGFAHGVRSAVAEEARRRHILGPPAGEWTDAPENAALETRLR
jgi:hypothetical protein